MSASPNARKETTLPRRNTRAAIGAMISSSGLTSPLWQRSPRSSPDRNISRLSGSTSDAVGILTLPGIQPGRPEAMLASPRKESAPSALTRTRLGRGSRPSQANKETRAQGPPERRFRCRTGRDSSCSTGRPACFHAAKPPSRTAALNSAEGAQHEPHTAPPSPAAPWNRERRGLRADAEARHRFCEQFNRGKVNSRPSAGVTDRARCRRIARRECESRGRSLRP